MTPGDRLLHPVSLAASEAYLFDDWWLKAHHPGLVSGKLADVAGMIVLPLTLYALAEWIARRPLSTRWLVAAIAVSAVGFAAVEVWTPAETAWCAAWGWMQWPFRAVAGWMVDGVVPPMRPVAAWSDPTDLLAIPAGALALLARR